MKRLPFPDEIEQFLAFQKQLKVCFGLTMEEYVRSFEDNQKNESSAILKSAPMADESILDSNGLILNDNLSLSVEALDFEISLKFFGITDISSYYASFQDEDRKKSTYITHETLQVLKDEHYLISKSEEYSKYVNTINESLIKTPKTNRLKKFEKESDLTYKDHWPPNSSDLNPLDYSIWDEFVHVINWDKVKSKATLIQELKRAVKNIREEVVFESCNSWTNRLYRLSTNDFGYLR
ncbi:unnamed protein product [Didymodactylos carnosus]|uniref:Uncharacterized protein n=1 Tax=Didymodactylos carnosus TaxID=1234261 RepID=A0A814Q408_9BILA|nr:unnamed protein product [Didymodactylos carnosus]CAF1114419.1 unnamed protein product [Didymodactylos carnosus]CAF3684838.1 unnamed protein product [Didymodactylos carnosus]CAF3878503.1 unnamed protein product [Didymodactylos carnosus]